MPDIPGEVPLAVRQGQPTVWLNPHRVPATDLLPTLSVSRAAVGAAEPRWRSFDPLLARLFDELATGRIDSPLRALSEPLARRVTGGADGAVWVKADHDLPVTGCIKARGGVY